MRRSNYITMFDPLQLKYGRKIGALLILPQIMSDTFWGASVLAALGKLDHCCVVIIFKNVFDVKCFAIRSNNPNEDNNDKYFSKEM